MKFVPNNYISTAPIRGDYLAHHGIMGQKWGVRRYQNEDGTLTPAGKERYGSNAYTEYKNTRATVKAQYKKQKSEARLAYKNAKKDANRAFNKAYNNNYKSFSFNKDKRAESNKNWEDYYDKALAEDAAKTRYESLTFSGTKAGQMITMGGKALGAALIVYGAYKLNSI